MTRILHAVTAILGALVAVALSANAALAEKRVALIIGNSTYQNAPVLPNPVKDANLVAGAFKTAKFDLVIVQKNVRYMEFKSALRQFEEAARDADIAVIYYAGHGIQVKDMNYMIPIDANLVTQIAAEDEAVSLERIVQAIEPAKKLRLVILDACRDNPFEKKIQRVSTRSIGSRGLANLEPRTGQSGNGATLVAYAARAGMTAEDGDDSNSPFAAALAKNLASQGVDVRIAFGHVRDEVLKATGNRQEPYIAGSIGGDIVSLNPAPEEPKMDQAKMWVDFDHARQLGTKQAYQAFIEKYKSGIPVDRAREELEKIEAAGVPFIPRAPANAPEIVTAAQKKLARIGCYDGQLDGKFSDATKAAIARYQFYLGRPATPVDLTEDFVSNMKEQGRVCPCPSGQVAKGEICIAAAPTTIPIAATPPSNPIAVTPPARPAPVARPADDKGGRGRDRVGSRPDDRNRAKQSGPSAPQRVGPPATVTSPTSPAQQPTPPVARNNFGPMTGAGY